MRVKNGLKIYFDGGCRPNPGQMETAVVVRGNLTLHPDCGYGTSNDAEWLALINAVEVALAIGAQDIILLGDSAIVIGQASGLAKCRSPELRAYLERFQTLSQDLTRIRLRRISRSQNLAGIALDQIRR
jgi:ribonuclease HI